MNLTSNTYSYFYIQEMRDELLTKIIPSLVTLLSAEAEIQYVALSYVCSILKQFTVPFAGSYKVRLLEL